MNCSHPVLYRRNGVMVCTVCGCEVGSRAQVDNKSTEAAKPAEAPKKPVKRTRKKR